MLFVSVELSGICREPEHCLACGERRHCASEGSTLSLLSHFPVVSAPSPTEALPRREVIVTKATPGSQFEMLEQRTPCSPALRSLAGVAFLRGHISTCRCPRISVLWLLRYCFTCTFPSQARLAG